MKTHFRLLLCTIFLTITTAAFASEPQIHIKARFFEVPKEDFATFQYDFRTANDATEILTAEATVTLLQKLQSDSGVMVLGEPEVVTTSGRQTEMRMAQVITVITNYSFQENRTSRSIVCQSGTLETGPALDVFPNARSDGYTIDLKTTAWMTEFLGYGQPTNTTTVHNSGGEKIEVPKFLPEFRVQKASSDLKLTDGQTLVLALKSNSAVGIKPEAQNKEVLVLITVTLVDSTGNRIHPYN